MKTCVSHHFACDCRERRLAAIIKIFKRASGHGEDCICVYCVEADELLHHGHPEGAPTPAEDPAQTKLPI